MAPFLLDSTRAFQPPGSHLFFLCIACFFVSPAQAQRQSAGLSTTTSVSSHIELIRFLHQQERNLQEGKLDDLCRRFSDELSNSLSRNELQDLWAQVRAATNEIRDVDYRGTRAIGSAVLQRFEIEGMNRTAGSWDMLLATDGDVISGLWLLKTPTHGTDPNPLAGHRFGKPITDIAQWKHQLKIDVQRSSKGNDPTPDVSFKFTLKLYRSLTGSELANQQDWNELETGKTWRFIRQIHADQAVTLSTLNTGNYRIVAETSKGELATSGPVTLQGNSSKKEINLILQPSTRVEITSTASDSDDILTDVHFNIETIDTNRPPKSTYVRESNGKVFIDLPPGKYQAIGRRNASSWRGIRYDTKAASSVIVVPEPSSVSSPGSPLEVTIPMFPRKLTAEEIDNRVPWVAKGRVTDEQGKPVEGVEIWGTAGFGSLRSIKLGTTDANGDYWGRFATSGFQTISFEADRLESTSAYVNARKEGLFESNLSRHGQMIAASRLPRADEKQASWVNDAQVFLPGVPVQLDFVMKQAAQVTVTLLDSEGNSIENSSVALAGEELPPMSSVLAQRTTDKNGQVIFLEVPTGFNWWIRSAIEPREYAKTPSMKFEAKQYEIVLRQTKEPKTNMPVFAIESSVVINRATNKPEPAYVLNRQPLEMPPLDEAGQKTGRKLLASIRDAGKYWLGNPPVVIKHLEYEFVLDNGRRQRVLWDGQSLSKRRGISYHSALDYATSRPDQVIFRSIDVGEKRIQLAYTFTNPVKIFAGVGVTQSWRGFFSTTAKSGVLIVDSETLTPIEHRTSKLTETYSDYVHVTDGFHVPLRIRISKMNFDWKFKLHPGNLWLFDRTNSKPKPTGQLKLVSLGPELDAKREIPFNEANRLRHLIQRLEGKTGREQEIAMLRQQLELLQISEDNENSLDFRTKHVIVSATDIPIDYVQAIGKTVEEARRICVQEYGYSMPHLIRISVNNHAKKTRLFNDGVDHFVLSVTKTEELQQPSRSGIFHLYGLCHEVSHLAMYRPIKRRGWMTGDAKEGWAHFLGSHIVDEVHTNLGANLWPDHYDYLADGTKRLNQQLESEKPSGTVIAASHWQSLLEGSSHREVAAIFAKWGSVQIDSANPIPSIRSAMTEAAPKLKTNSWLEESKSLFVIPAKE